MFSVTLEISLQIIPFRTFSEEGYIGLFCKLFLWIEVITIKALTQLNFLNKNLYPWYS